MTILSKISPYPQKSPTMDMQKKGLNIEMIHKKKKLAKPMTDMKESINQYCYIFKLPSAQTSKINELQILFPFLFVST